MPDPLFWGNLIRELRRQASRVGAVSMRRRRNGEFRSWCWVSRFQSPITSAPMSSFASSMVPNGGSSAPHRSCTTLIGEADTMGDAMLPRNRVRTSWNGTGHL